MTVTPGGRASASWSMTEPTPPVAPTEEHDLLTRTVYAEVPARVDYELTDLGRSASKPLRGLRYWVEASVDLTP